LVFDNAGNLYGTTIDGGTPKCGPFGRGGRGTVYQLTPNPDGTWKENILYRFPGGADGAEPYAGVIFDAAGNLYGTTAAGGNTENGGFGYGTAFELSPGTKGWTETLLHTFATQAGDGQSPTAPLTFDTSGNLYGTTYQGLNPCSEGTIFQLTLNPQGGWTENELHCFSGADSDGAYLAAGVTFDDAGNLYTPTYLGGTDGEGTVLELKPSGGRWTENILYDFSLNGGGPAPYASLVADRDGILYGVAGASGPNSYGTVYELTPSGAGWTYTVIYGFTGGPDGAGPESLIIDSAGNLYGTTAGGGAGVTCRGGCGTVFRLTHKKNGWKKTRIYSFRGGAGGANPYGGLVLDQQGNLYGTTFYGGGKQCQGGCGLVFEMIP